MEIESLNTHAHIWQDTSKLIGYLKKKIRDYRTD